MPTASGFLFLTVVLDAWSRKVVGWAMARHLKTELVLQALNMPLGQRRPQGEGKLGELVAAQRITGEALGALLRGESCTRRR